MAANGRSILAPLIHPALPPNPVRARSIGERGAIALLLLALAVGGMLRFVNLGDGEMSADEGASWAAANAISVRDVLELQPKLNPGKLAVHEVALHGWIRLFGDGLGSMRALSAIAGTLAIVAVFIMVRELMDLNHTVNPEAENGGEPSSIVVAAFTAVLFAVNLVFIKYAQEARMYSLALLSSVAQIGVLLHSLHRPALLWVFLTAFFTALAIATTFTMSLILPPEILWLAYLGLRGGGAICHRAALAALALLSGLLLLIPPLMMYLHARQHAPSLVGYAWASKPPMWAPLSMFNKATGDIAFPIEVGLGLWGVFRAWGRKHIAVVFLLLWMLIPPILVLAASYLVRPAFVERYMLASFVPFFWLVALGLWHTKGVFGQCALLTLLTLASLGHLYSYRQHPHDVQWREAARAASEINARAIFVAPPYAADVVRYYLRGLPASFSVGPARSSAPVAIVADTGVSATEAARISTAFPRSLLHLRGVNVRKN